MPHLFDALHDKRAEVLAVDEPLVGLHDTQRHLSVNSPWHHQTRALVKYYRHNLRISVV